MLDGFERVHVELDWYDGPRGGLADVGGVVHYFQAVSHLDDSGGGTFFVWPAGRVRLGA